MLKLVLVLAILIPVALVLLTIYVRLFRRKFGPIIEAPPPPPAPSTRDELNALRAEYAAKKAAIVDLRESKALEAKIAGLDKQIADLDAPHGDPRQ